MSSASTGSRWYCNGVTDGHDRGEGPPRLERVKPAMPRAPRGAEITPAAAIAAALDHTGALRTGAALHLCYLAAAAQATGRLVLTSGRAQYTVHFKRGVVEHAASSAPEDDLGRFLAARGVLAPDAL